MVNEINKYMPFFSILIPAYNEENNIVATVVETAKVLEKFNPDYEIIVIDDGSTDATYKNICAFLDKNNEKISVKRYSPNKGKGYALKYGTGFAQGKYVLFLDADLDLHPSLLIDLYNTINKENADASIGSKMHKDSVLEYPFLRKLLSSSYYLIVKALFRLSLKDTQTGIKLFKAEVLKKCLEPVLINRYAFDLELLVSINKRGYKIVEAPVHVSVKRQLGRVGLLDALKVFADTMRVFWRLNFKKHYCP